MDLNNLYRLIYAVIIFISETIIQTVFISIEIKYFDEFHTYVSFAKIFSWQIYYVGSLKSLLCLPVYLLFYYFMRDRYSVVQWSKRHSVIFFLSFMVSWMITLPFGASLIDFAALPILSFINSMLVNLVCKSWLRPQTDVGITLN